MTEELKNDIHDIIYNDLFENGMSNYNDVLWTLVNVHQYMLDIEESILKSYIDEQIIIIDKEI